MNAYVPGCLAFGAWAAAVAIGDCRARRVPNALVALGLCAALAASLLHAGPLRIGVGEAFAACLVGFCALMPLYVLGVMGAGDVKVFAVLGAWCGLHALLALWVVASLVAGVHAVVVLIALRARAARANAVRTQVFTVGARRGAPYAAFLTVPALVWLAWLGLQFAAGSLR
jgi:prepilin peptidase CpaA